MRASATYREQPLPLVVLMADEDAFRAWYEEVLPRVYRYLHARTGGDVLLAEELTQDTFHAAVRARAQFDGRADAVTWLCAIGRRRLIDHYRRAGRDQRRHGRLRDAHRDETTAPWQESETRDAVSDALGELSGDQRLALTLRYLDDLSVAEVAAALGRSLSGAESLLVRARDAFRSAYRGPSHE